MFLYYFFYRMKFRKIFIFIVLFLIVLNQVFSNLFFSEILPNTDDDATLEYIELYNSSNTIMFLSWFVLKDKSNKQFTFNDSYFLNPYEKKKYFRSETKILLNDTDEQLFIYDNFWNLLDSYSYLTTENWKVIVIWQNIIETQTWTVIDESVSSGIDTETWTIVNLDTLTWTIDIQTWILDNQEDTNTWVIVSSSWILQNDVTIPEIDYKFQSPSYLLEKDNKVSAYNCDSSKEECKVNLDFSSSFTWSYKISDFDCETNFWFDTWDENKCNPATIIVPEWTFDFYIKIKSKNDSSKFSELTFKVINKWYIKPIASPSNIYISNVYTDVSKPLQIIMPEIIIQSGLNEKNECTNKKSCSVNFLYEAKSSKERCIWDFWWWAYELWIEQKCNPWYVKYLNWEYTVKLKVFEEWNISNYNQSELRFNNFPAITNINDDKKIEQKEKVVETKEKNVLLVNKSDIDIKPWLNVWNIKISKIMPNPSWNDDDEYIEIINKWNDDFNLSVCSLDDVVDWWSKVFSFKKGEIIKKWETKRYIKDITKLNLNNNLDEVNLFCNNTLIDKLSWNFKVKDWYYLDHSRLDIFSGKAKVLEVIDWDTLKIEFLSSKKVEKLRLIWIDTPETKDPRKNVQAFWQEAYDYVNDSIKWEDVTVEMDPNNFRDKYSRLLWFVYFDWESFNKKLIEQWFAKAYTNYDFKYLDEYKKAETVAKKNNLWIWAINTESKEKIVEKSLVADKNKKLEAVITIQSKLTSKKILTWNTITCFDTCSINFDWSKSNWNIKKYSWDFWNWKKYDWKNPASINYEKFWNYKVYLAVSSDTWELNTKTFVVNFYKSPKKEKKKSIVTKVEWKWNDKEIKNKDFEQDNIDLETDNNSIYYYVFLAIFWIVLVVVLLRKEKMI